MAGGLPDSERARTRGSAVVWLRDESRLLEPGQARPRGISPPNAMAEARSWPWPGPEPAVRYAHRSLGISARNRVAFRGRFRADLPRHRASCPFQGCATARASMDSF